MMREKSSAASEGAKCCTEGCSRGGGGRSGRAPQKVAEHWEMEEHQALWGGGTKGAKALRWAVPAGSRMQGGQCAERQARFTRVNRVEKRGQRGGAGLRGRKRLWLLVCTGWGPMRAVPRSSPT